MFNIKDGQKILFIGDSITDCGRSQSTDINFLGHGYPIFIASLLGARHPEMDLTFINTGVSGHTSAALRGRWSNDVINHKPDVVSILVGINDVFGRYTMDRPTDAMTFGDNCRFFIENTKENLPDAQIVFMEPFLLDVREEHSMKHADLSEKIRAIRSLVTEYKLPLIPLDGIFAAAAGRREMTYWLGDGIHPTAAGHALIAESWIEAAGLK